MGLSQPLIDYVAPILATYTTDPQASNIFTALQHDPHSKHSFQLYRDLLYYKPGIFVPAMSP